jgi:hypothetical protein
MNIEKKEEHEAWKHLCNVIQSEFNLTNQEFNDSDKIKNIIIAIEKWGYCEACRRKVCDDWKNEGNFY